MSRIVHRDWTGPSDVLVLHDAKTRVLRVHSHFYTCLIRKISTCYPEIFDYFALRHVNYDALRQTPVAAYTYGFYIDLYNKKNLIRKELFFYLFSFAISISPTISVRCQRNFEDEWNCTTNGLY